MGTDPVLGIKAIPPATGAVRPRESSPAATNVGTGSQMPADSFSGNASDKAALARASADKTLLDYDTDRDGALDALELGIWATQLGIDVKDLAGTLDTDGDGRTSKGELITGFVRSWDAPETPTTIEVSAKPNQQAAGKRAIASPSSQIPVPARAEALATRVENTHTTDPSTNLGRRTEQNFVDRLKVETDASRLLSIKYIVQNRPEFLAPSHIETVALKTIRELLGGITDSELDKLRLETRRALVVKLDDRDWTMQGRILASITRTSPDDIAPKDLQACAHKSIRNLLSSITDPELDKLQPEAKLALCAKLESGWTSGAEYEMVGRLMASLIRIDPKKFEPKDARALSDSSICAIFKNVSDRELDKLNPETRRALFNQLDAGWTTDEESAVMTRITGSLARKQ